MSVEPSGPASADAASAAPQRRARAVALAYGAGDGAPRVVAKGHGELAARIVARARDAGVFVHESPELVALLMQIDLDARIPPALYVAVAELLAWIWRVDGAMPKTHAGPSMPLPSPLRGADP